MIDKYNVVNFDWMHYRITRINPMTYHHIVKRENGGKETFKNGALLTLFAQQYLHLIELYDLEIYNRINSVLREINRQGHCPTKEQEESIERELINFEQRYFYELRRRKGVGKHERFDPTEDRRYRQQGRYERRKTKRMVKSRKTRLFR